MGAEGSIYEDGLNDKEHNELMLKAIELREEEVRLKAALQSIQEERDIVRKRFAAMGMEVSSFTSVIIVKITCC